MYAFLSPKLEKNSGKARKSGGSVEERSGKIFSENRKNPGSRVRIPISCILKHLEIQDVLRNKNVKTGIRGKKQGIREQGAESQGKHTDSAEARIEKPAQNLSPGGTIKR